MNYKIRANNSLVKMGLKVPPYFVMSKQDMNRLNSILISYSEVDFWYLRSIKSEENIISRRVVNTACLGDVLNDAFLKNPNAQIIVQERVDVESSGVLSVNGKLLFVEYVKGGLQSLLRDGCTPSRVILDWGGDIEAHQENRQEFWYRWDAERIVKESSISGTLLLQEICDALIKAAHLVKRPVVYEWVKDQKGNVFFIDIKPTKKAFLIDKAILLSELKKETIASLDLPIKGNVIKDIKTSDKGVFILKNPLHSYLETISRKATAFIFESGGVLSHLVVYSARYQIPCIISYKLYNKYVFQPEVNISVTQLLNNNN